MTATRLSGPQKAAALVLALSEEQASALLGRMQEDEVRELSTAMASLGAVSAGSVEDLCREFTEALGRAGNLSGGLASTERLLLRVMPRERVDQIMEELRGPAGRTMCIQALLRGVEKDRLALALKGASEGLRELFFKNLTERAAKLLRDDIAALGPVRLRDVDEAQAAVVVLAKDMAAQGQLTLKDAREEEMLA